MGGPRVAVVGATGAVGRAMISILEEREFPLADLVPMASARSEGKRVRFNGEELTVRALGERWFEGIDLALVSAGGAVSKEILPPAAAAGTVSIDNSSAWRMDPKVPLVVPEINPQAAFDHQGILANANCTAITALMAVAPLHRAFELRSVITSSYQSVSGAGWKGVLELAEQVEKLHGQEEDLAHPDPQALPRGDVFARTIAFNVVPRVETFDPAGSGFTTEELKMGWEFRKVLGLPDLSVAATAVRVPVPVGHAVSIYAQFERDVSPDGGREAIESAPGVRVMDDPATDTFPTPLDAAGMDDVLVGRIRQPDDNARALMLFAVGDNLRKGAALNTVQIAELLTTNDRRAG
ncbi:MAG: aspartate-semialdehyde dehydrogenase [Actinomycetota bacterium]